jgi:DNA-binding transcriptional regulator YdaS (Cro superfamily)
MLIPNNVKIAVKRAGGPTKVALLLGCSGTAVHAWMRKKKISDITKAEKLAKATGMNVRDLRPCR